MSNSNANRVFLQFPGPVTLRVSRATCVWLLLICVLVLLLSAWAALKGSRPALILFIPFGVLTIFCTSVLLSSKEQLTLGANGFVITNGRRSTTFRWDEVGRFEVHFGHRSFVRSVYFTMSQLAVDRRASQNGVLPGRPFVMPVTFRTCIMPDIYGFSADELARLLNQWRNRALGAAVVLSRKLSPQYPQKRV